MNEIRNLLLDITKLSQRKLTYLQDLLRYTEKQSRLINLEKVEDLSKEINKKNILIEKIKPIDKEYNIKYIKLLELTGKNSINDIDSMTYPNVKELIKALKNIKNILEKIKDIDKNNRYNLEKKCNEMKLSFNKVKEGKKATNAYSAYDNQVKSMFFDKRK